MRLKHTTTWWMSLFVAVASLAATNSDLRLVDAAKNQDRQAVRALLKQKVDVNARHGDGATALHWAAYWDDQDTVDLLLRAGAAVNAPNDHGATPLWLACNNASAAMVERLLQAGADPNAALASGETPLMTASRTGNVDAVNLLLAHGANANAKERARGQTALMWAVAQQHPEVVQALVERGADLHARSHIRVRLVNTGVAGNAAGFDPTGVVEEEQGGFTPLLFAARHGALDSGSLLVAAGAHVNDTAPNGASVLVMAAHSGHGPLAALLLEKGADPNAAGAGYTALQAAILRGDLDLVKALLAHGANPNAPLMKGTPVRRSSTDWALGHALVGATPFWLAANFLEPTIMQVLAANGADPLFAKDGTTPLLAAMAARINRGRFRQVAPDSGEEERSILEAAKVAVELGADVNAANAAGDTALHGAASRRLNTVVQFLAERGASLDVKNKRGQTPLAIAATPRRAADGTDQAADDGQRTADLLRKLGAKE